jgi:hypothetical protein
MWSEEFYSGIKKQLYIQNYQEYFLILYLAKIALFMYISNMVFVAVYGFKYNHVVMYK